MRLIGDAFVTHKAALTTLAAAAALDAAGAGVFSAVEHHSILDSFYWALATATTVGYGDVVPHTSFGKVLAIVVFLTVIPLFAATFSLLTSTLTNVHVKTLHDKVDHLIKHSSPPFPS